MGDCRAAAHAHHVHHTEYNALPATNQCALLSHRCRNQKNQTFETIAPMEWLSFRQLSCQMGYMIQTTSLVGQIQME